MKPLELIFPDDVKKYMDLQCNGKIERYTELPELKYMQEEMKGFNPMNVLEIGCGIGRGAVALNHYYDLKDTTFYMLDGDTGEIQCDGVRKDGDKEFYNSFDATVSFCSSNGILPERLKILDAADDRWMIQYNIQYDFVFSLLAIGFHWPVSLYLDKIHYMLAHDCKLLFGLRGTEKMEFVMEQVNSIDTTKYSIEKLIVEKTHERSSIIVLRKV